MKRELVTGISAFALYLILSWPPSLQDTALGAIVALVVASAFSKYLVRDESKLSPKRLIKLISYCIWYLTIVELKAHIGGLKAALIPSTINPKVLKLKAVSRSDYAVAWLANSITNTPGTVTVDVRGDELYVHCLFGELGREPKEFDRKAHEIFD